MLAYIYFVCVTCLLASPKKPSSSVPILNWPLPLRFVPGLVRPEIEPKVIQCLALFLLQEKDLSVCGSRADQKGNY